MFSKQSNHLSLDILFNSLDSKIWCGLKNNYHCVIIRIIPLHCCSKQCCYFNTFITQKKKMITLRFFINYRSAATVKNDISCLGSNWLVLFHRFYSKDHQYRYIANFTSFSSFTWLLFSYYTLKNIVPLLVKYYCTYPIKCCTLNEEMCVP